MRKVFLLLIIIVWSCKVSPRTTSHSTLLVDTSKRYIGVPYKYGGTTTKGMDCSGLVYLSFADLGKKIARPSYDQAKEFTEIKKNKMQPGDLVYFKIGRTSRINHTGIITKVVSNEIVLFIHSSSSAGVREDNLY